MRVESPSSPREGCSISTGIRLVMQVRLSKILVKIKSKSRILGDVNSIPSGGGVPEGKRGSLTPMSGDGSFVYFPEHDVTLERALPLQDEQPIQSTLENAAHSERAPPSMASWRSN